MTFIKLQGTYGSSRFPWRGELFASVFIIGFVNGIVVHAIDVVSSVGFADAFINTFGVSAIVWVASFIAISLMFRARREVAGGWDIIAAFCVLGLFLIPAPPVSWISLSGIAAYAAFKSERSSIARQAACIMLAVTVPMFWSRMVFSALSDFILQFDATLVSWMVGTPRVGNTIEFADGSGYLWIAPGCSSIANVSLAILCWVVFSQLSDRKTSVRSVAWCAFVCSAVVAVNVTRISLLGLYPGHYETLHGPVGNSLVNWITVAVIVGMCLLGTVRQRHAVLP